MEERIQRKVEELKMKIPHYFFKPPPTYESLREEAIRIIQEEIAQEEELKKRIQQQKEEYVRIQQKWKETQEKQVREKEEEERERIRVLQQKEDPDRPLTIKDIRAIPGFDYDHYRRALDELNVEILKRVARETYAHKFKRV